MQPLVLRPANTPGKTVQVEFPDAGPPVVNVDHVKYAVERVRMITMTNAQEIDAIRPEDRRMRETMSGFSADTYVYNGYNVLCFNFHVLRRPCLFGYAGVRQLTLCYSVLPVALLGDNSKSKDSCPICLETDDAPSSWSMTLCCHSFHSDCLRGWLGRGKTACPLCRGAISHD